MRSRQQHRQPVLAAEREVDLGELRGRGGAHVGVEVRDVEAGRERRLDLGAHSVSTARRVGVPAHRRHVRPHEAVVVDQAGLLRGGRDRPPAAGAQFAGERQMDAEIELRLLALRSTVSANQGQGTMTEAVVTKPCPASSTKARLAPWHTADVVDVRDQDARVGRIAERRRQDRPSRGLLLRGRRTS